MSRNSLSTGIGIRRHTMRVLTIALAFAALVASREVAPAQAWTYQNTGCAGSVQVPTINGSYLFGPLAYGPNFEFPQRFAWRSPCYSAYTQVINIRYRLWFFNLSTRQWSYAVETSRTATVAAGYAGASMSAWGRASNWSNISGDVLVEWRLTNGALIGSTYINYDSVGDYSCQSSVCRVYSDPVVGAYLHLA